MSQETDPTPRVSLRPVRALLDEGRLAEAEAACRGVLESAPNHHKALSMLANILRDGCKFDEEIAVLRRAIAEHPDDYRLGRRLVERLGDMGAEDEAKDECRRQIDAAPDNPRPVMQLLNMLRRRKAWKEGAKLVRRARKMDRKAIPPLLFKGDRAMDRGKAEAAGRSYRRAFALKPENPNTMRLLAFHLIHIGEHDAARRLLEPSLTVADAGSIAKLLASADPDADGARRGDVAWSAAWMGQSDIGGWLDRISLANARNAVISRHAGPAPAAMLEAAGLLDQRALDPFKAPGAGPAIFVTAHIGPPSLASHAVLEARANAHAVVEGSLKLCLNFPERIINVRWGDTAKALLKCREVLLDGGILHLAADAPTGERTEPFEWNGRRIELSRGPAMLAYITGAPIYWCVALWRGEKMVIEVDRMISPEPDESAADWRARWRADYGAKLVSAIRGDAENFANGRKLWR